MNILYIVRAADPDAISGDRPRAASDRAAGARGAARRWPQVRRAGTEGYAGRRQRGAELGQPRLSRQLEPH